MKGRSMDVVTVLQGGNKRKRYVLKNETEDEDLNKGKHGGSKKGNIASLALSNNIVLPKDQGQMDTTNSLPRSAVAAPQLHQTQ